MVVSLLQTWLFWKFESEVGGEAEERATIEKASMNKVPYEFIYANFYHDGAATIVVSDRRI